MTEVAATAAGFHSSTGRRADSAAATAEVIVIAHIDEGFTFGATANNFSCRNCTVSLPPESVDPWFVSVRTRRYLLGALGVHSVVVPSSLKVFVCPFCQVLWLPVATGVHGPKFASLVQISMSFVKLGPNCR